MAGDYTETYGGRTASANPQRCLFHPQEELHAEHFHNAGGHSFIIEIEPLWLEGVRARHASLDGSAGFKGGVMSYWCAGSTKNFVHMEQCLGPHH